MWGLGSATSSVGVPGTHHLTTSTIQMADRSARSDVAGTPAGRSTARPARRSAWPACVGGRCITGSCGLMEPVAVRQMGRLVPCEVRALDAPSGLCPQLRQNWPRHRTWARWAGTDVVVRLGLLRTRTVVVAVRPTDDGFRGVPACEVRRCGRFPLVMELVLLDGSRVEVAAPGSSRSALVGPFLAAAVHALSQAPTGIHHRRRRQTPNRTSGVTAGTPADDRGGDRSRPRRNRRSTRFVTPRRRPAG